MSFAGKLEDECSVANILSEADILSSVTTLRRVCESCLGPCGRCHLIHNDVGGYVVLTSGVERLFSATPVSCPALRLLISAVQHHSSMHSDGATTTAALSLLMIERALRMSVQRKRSLVVDLLDVVAEAATSYLTSDQCPVKRPLQLDNLCDLQQLVRGFCHSSCCYCSQNCAFTAHGVDTNANTVVELNSHLLSCF